MFKPSLRVILLSAALLAAVWSPSFASVTFQDFESNNSSDQYGWQINSQVDFSTGARDGFHNSGQPVFTGRRSWKVASNQYWVGGTGIQSQTQRWEPIRTRTYRVRVRPV